MHSYFVIPICDALFLYFLVILTEKLEYISRLLYCTKRVRPAIHAIVIIYLFHCCNKLSTTNIIKFQQRENLIIENHYFIYTISIIFLSIISIKSGIFNIKQKKIKKNGGIFKTIECLKQYISMIKL